MSHAPPPHQPLPPTGSAGPKKPRPSAGWFVVGIALILGAVLVGVGLFVWTLSAFMDTDATIDADGQAHRVHVEAGAMRMLWTEPGFSQDCRIIDRETGRQIELDPVSASYERSDESGQWRGYARFDPGSGDLEITCTASEGSVLIGAAPHIGSFVVGILATILVPLGLGLAGTAVLIVTGILWSVRPARPKRPKS